MQRAHDKNSRVVVCSSKTLVCSAEAVVKSGRRSNKTTTNDRPTLSHESITSRRPHVAACAWRKPASKRRSYTTAISVSTATADTVPQVDKRHRFRVRFVCLSRVTRPYPYPTLPYPTLPYIHSSSLTDRATERQMTNMVLHCRPSPAGPPSSQPSPHNSASAHPPPSGMTNVNLWVVCLCITQLTQL